MHLIPLVSDVNGNVTKIVSIDVQYSLTPKNKPRSAQDVTQSVLSTGEWYKFSIDTTGVYKIDRAFLSSLGLDLTGVDPHKIAIYGNGGKMLPFVIGEFRYPDLEENSIYVHGEQDGSFDEGDYILFYGVGPDDWVHEGTRESVKHRINPFSTKAYYYIHIKQNNAMRILPAPVAGSAAEIELTNYDAYALHERDLTTLSSMGRQWQGELFHLENEKNFLIDFEPIDPSVPLRIRTRVAHDGKLAPSNMQVSLNGNNLYTITINSYNGEYFEGRANESTTEVTSATGELTFQLNFSGSPNTKGYLDFIEVTGMKKLQGTGKQFGFRNFDAGNHTTVRYRIQNASDYSIWDVSDYTHPLAVQTQLKGNDINFVYSGGLKEFVALHPQDYLVPQKPDNPLVENQNLH
jgi:hypothetical protein